MLSLLYSSDLYGVIELKVEEISRLTSAVSR
jgi:hypothetical protein